MNDMVQLSVPADALYSMPLRLFISGLAARLNFSLDTIEDIKTAFSEVCVLLLRNIDSGVLELSVSTEKALKINASVKNAKYLKNNASDFDIMELSKLIIKSLADNSEIISDNNIITAVNLTFYPGE